MTQPTGRQIGRYEVMALLGRGGMAEVYRARDPNLGREVAIKLILPALAEEENFDRRFATEARAVARLAHPNIVQVYDFGTSEGGPYMVMEFVPGGTLKERIKAAAAPLPFEVVARVVREIGRALDDAHGKGIIHRDVKPANIMFRADGGPVLADFGIARVTNATQLTATSALTGTPAYMAPEQINGQPAPQSDLYSLAVALFEMLTGRLPFTASTATEMAIKHLQVDAPSPLSIRPDLPAPIEALMRIALAKDPAKRFPSGHALSAALETALGLDEATAPGGAGGLARPVPAVVVQPPRGRLSVLATVLAAFAGRRFESRDREGRLGRLVSIAGVVSLLMAALQTVLSSISVLSNALELLSRYLAAAAVIGLVTAGLIALGLAWVSPRYRSRALAGVAILAVLSGGLAAWQAYQRARPARGPVIVIAEFKQCPGCPYDAADDAIYNDLLRYSEAKKVLVEVRRARTTDRPQIGDTRAARQLGAEEKAALVIWGFHTAGAVAPQFEVVGDPGARADVVSELRSFGYRLENADPGLAHIAPLALGIIRYQQGDDEGALRLFTAAIENLPVRQTGLQAGFAYFFRANTRARTGQPVADIVADLENARGMNPGVAEIRQNLAVAYIGACKADGSTALDLALAEMVPVLQSGQTGPRPYEIEGSILFLADRLDEAADAYEEALRRGSPTPQVKDDLIAAYQRLGRKADADRIAKTIAPAPVATATLPLSITLEQADRAWYAANYSEASQLYQKAIPQARELSRTSELIARLYRDAGWSEFSAGEWQKAAGLLEQSLTLAPRFFGLRSNSLELNYTLLGNSYLKLAHHDKAIDTFARALKTRPCAGFALNGLARAYSLQGKSAEALATFQRLAKAEPGNGLAEIQIALTLQQLGRPEAEATAALKTGYDKIKAWVAREPGSAQAMAALDQVAPLLK